MPTENKLYDKADTSTAKMTSLWDLGEMVPRKKEQAEEKLNNSQRLFYLLK